MRRRRFVRIISLFGFLPLLPGWSIVSSINKLINRFTMEEWEERDGFAEDREDNLKFPKCSKDSLYMQVSKSHIEFPHREMCPCCSSPAIFKSYIELYKYEELIGRYEKEHSIETFVEILSRLAKDYGVIVCIDPTDEYSPYLLREIVTEKVSRKYRVTIEPIIPEKTG